MQQYLFKTKQNVFRLINHTVNYQTANYTHNLFQINSVFIDNLVVNHTLLKTSRKKKRSKHFRKNKRKKQLRNKTITYTKHIQRSLPKHKP